MTSDTKLVRFRQAVRIQGRARQAWNFVQHYLEMCLAMCLGLAVLDPFFTALASQFSYTDPETQIAQLTVLVAALNMTLPMAAWMRIRGMEWRPIAEMSGAMFLEAILLIGIARLGLLPESALYDVFHQLMMPVMLIPMLLRINLYAGGMGHHAHAG